MPLVKGDISNPLKEFINKLNTSTQEDKNVAIQQFCDQIETVVFKAMKKATITIKPGSIKTVGSATAQTNVVPVIENNAIS